MILRIIFFALISYVVLLLIVFIFQRKLLYLPDTVQLSQKAAADIGIRHWPAYQTYRGYTRVNETADAQGTVIVFHGNAGAAHHREYLFDGLSPRGLRVIVSEYPGYGGRQGTPTETVLVDDALETIRLAHKAYGEPIYLWGESLGAGVVSSVIKKTKTPVKGVVLFTPWDSLANVAQSHYAFLPVRWLIKDTYNSVENLQTYNGNVAVVLAANDEIIPVAHGKNLHASISNNKRLWVFDDATHNTMPVDAQLPWWSEVTEFISTAPHAFAR